MTARTRIGEGLVRFWRGLISEPIERGRLRDTGWPRGLAPVVVIGVFAFCLAVLLILAAPLVRDLAPLSVSVGATVLSLPRAVLSTIVWLVILSLALMQTAALHTRRRTTIVLTTVGSLALLFIGSLDVGVDGEGGFEVTAGKIASVLAVLGIIVLIVVRRRGQFAWWEFPLVLGIVGLASVIALGRSAAESAPFGIDFAPNALALVMVSIGLLAVPAALAAGVAVAEFAVNAATSSVAALERPRARDREGAPLRSVPIVLVVAFTVVVLWRITEAVIGATIGVGSVVDPADLPLSIAIVAVIAGLWWVIARVRRAGVTTIDDVMLRLDDVGLPVAAALTATLAPVVVLLLSAQVLLAWGVGDAVIGGLFAVAESLRSSDTQSAVRFLVSIGLLIVAVITARRGGRGVPELLAAIAVITLASLLPTVAAQPPRWSYEAIAVTIAVGTLVLTIVLAGRQRLDARRLALLTIALLLSAAAAWRDLLADPLSALIGASGIALVLFGFVWGFVTDADVTHRGSEAYPVPARVMLFLANAVFGVTVLAFGTLARDLAAAIDLDAFAQFGDELLGTALILVAVMAVWTGASQRDSVDSRLATPSVSA
jgi:hypothetical protein